MWGWGRPRRDIPQVDYAESDDDDETNDEDFEQGLAFDSPLQSPVRPVPTRAGSPQLLAHPTLNDNVDEVLEDVTWKLHDHQQLNEEVEELTDLLVDANTKVGVDTDNGSDGIGEVVEESGVVFGQPQVDLCQGPSPP